MDEKALGRYLKDRRARLDPVALGFPLTRRRTPGLRREEVAQRANVSATWYTWLEQGRGGAPSASVLERLARALMLTEDERQYLFQLGLGRPPEVRQPSEEGITPRLQRVLDAFDYSPAFIKTFLWDVVAWNRAVATVLFDYEALAPQDRNILRLVFSNHRVRAAQLDWESVARFSVAAFRADATRAGMPESAERLVAELSGSSPEFKAIWQNNEIQTYGEGVKQWQHPQAGLIALEYSAFAVDGRPDLSMVVFNPSTPADTDRIRVLVESQSLPEFT